MSLEHTLLDRLEKRSLQIAQQKNESHGLRQLLNEKMAINEQLAEQITTARLEREQMQHQISELRTECDRIREISKSLVPKSALKQAVQEAAELHAEVVKLRAEVPLESTREGLKNAVAKLQEVTAQLDSAKGEAEEWLKQCNAARRQRDEVRAEARKETQRLSDLCAELQSKYESLLAKTTDLGSYAMTLGRKEGEPLEMFMERQALRLAALESKAGPSIETLSAELSVRYAEIAELHTWALALIENPSFAENAPEHTRNYRNIVERINSRPQLDLTATLPAVDWQAERITGLIAKLQEATTDRDRVLNELAAILAEANKTGRCGGDPVALIKQGQTDLDALTHCERDNARLDALVSKLQGELEKQKTQADSMERQVGGLTRTRLRLEFERNRMNAKLEPLEALYKTLKGYQDSDSIIGHGTIIEVAIDKATEALSQLTA